MRRMVWRAVSLTVALTALTGVAYPAFLWTVGRLALPWQAGGSLIRDDGGQVIGSTLIGQPFARPEYFHPRPSAVGYDGAGSGASNLGPTNMRRADSARRYAERFRAENALPADTPLPPDAVTTSGSGLDPDISPANAALQTRRVADARGVSSKRVAAIVRRYTMPPTLWVLGEPRVNVFALNLALDSVTGHR